MTLIDGPCAPYDRFCIWTEEAGHDEPEHMDGNCQACAGLKMTEKLSLVVHAPKTRQQPDIVEHARI